MERDDALSILGLSEGFSKDDLRNKYSELYNDYQLRITNAPTPNLKKLYQKNLQELSEAYEILSIGGQPVVSGNQHLPSSTPTLKRSEYNAPRPTEPTPPPPQERNDQKQHSSQPKGTGAALSGKHTHSQVKEKEGVNKITAIAITAAFVFLAVAVFFGIRSMEVQSQQEKEGDKLAKMDEVSAHLQGMQERFSNQKLKIKNLCKVPVKVKWIIAVYDEQGELTKVFDSPGHIMRPNSTYQPQIINEGAVTWDGESVSYAFGLEIEGSDVAFSGITSMHKNGEVVIDPRDIGLE